MSLPTVTRKFEIDAGHRLMQHKGKCKNYHGHRYVIEPQIACPTLESHGMIVDFACVKSLLGMWLDENWDHGMILQEGDPLIGKLENIDAGMKVYVMPEPPTVEHLVRLFAQNAQRLFKTTPGMTTLEVVHVRMYETPNCWADYTPIR